MPCEPVGCESQSDRKQFHLPLSNEFSKDCWGYETSKCRDCFFSRNCSEIQKHSVYSKWTNSFLNAQEICRCPVLWERMSSRSVTWSRRYMKIGYISKWLAYSLFYCSDLSKSQRLPDTGLAGWVVVRSGHEMIWMGKLGRTGLCLCDWAGLCGLGVVETLPGTSHNPHMLLWIFCRFCQCPIAGWSAAAVCTKLPTWTKCRSRQLTRGKFFSSMTCWW